MPDQSSASDEHALIQEITAPLQTLPDDPLALVEADFPTAMRGYDRHAVDDYVEQMSRLVAELQATRSPEAAVRRALERVGDQISGILQRAHETAEQITAQSRGEAEDRLEQARREGAAIIDAAEQRVRELDADTDRIWSERQQIVADAEDLSQRLHEVAREAAERFPVEDLRGTGVVAPGDDVALGPEDMAALEPEDAGTLATDQGVEAFEPEEDAEPLEPVEDEPFPDDVGEDEPQDAGEDDDPGIERTVPYPPVRPTEPGPTDTADDGEAEDRTEPLPRRLTDDDSTQIIPPASDAAQHRRES